MEDRLVRENLEYEKKVSRDKLLEWKAYWQEVKNPGCIEWGLIRTNHTYRTIEFYDNGIIKLEKASPRKKEGISYKATFKVFNENFNLNLYHQKEDMQYSIKREGNWLLRCADDITIANNIKTKEERITINTRKRSRKRKGKINGIYQLSFLEDTYNTIFISRDGKKRYLSIEDFLTLADGRIEKIEQETIFYLKSISGEFPLEGLSKRVTHFIKEMDNIDREKSLRKTK